MYYVPGNHDVGYVLICKNINYSLVEPRYSLGVSTLFSDHARDRYKAHFGPLNHQISIANHTMLFLDALELVEEDYQRRGQRLDYDHWKPIPGGTVEFVQSVTTGRHISHDFALNPYTVIPDPFPGPVILFSHVPLFRPDDTPCGPRREKGTIKANVGFGYQNTLGPATTEFLLRKIKPSVVFRFVERYEHNFSPDVIS